MSHDNDDSTKSPVTLSASEWWKVIKQIWHRLNQDQLQLLAAGVAFYFLLALFPMLSALVSLYGLIFGHADVVQHVGLLSGIAPEQFIRLLEQRLEDIASKTESSLSLGALAALGLAIWSGSKGIQALVKACNRAYQEQNKRAWWRTLFLRIIFTAGALTLILLIMSIVAALPFILDVFGQSHTGKWLIPVLLWPLCAFGFYTALLLLFRFSPDRQPAKWRWLTPGAIFSTLIWMLASASFSYYVANFANYEQNFGPVSGVIVLLMWFYISAFVILLGAELNSALEHHILADTTTGEPQPRGQRGAVVADTLPDYHDR